jgi:hypothetical protein
METFIVRAWFPPDDSAEADALRGIVEHVGSGHESAFVSESELLALLRAPAFRSQKRRAGAARPAGAKP